MDQLAPQLLRRAFGAFPSGVVAVCALDDAGRPAGMVVSTFIPVSLEPPLVALSMRAESRTWPVLRRQPSLGLSVLSTDQHGAARQLAMPEGDRFADLDLTATGRGALLLAGAPIHFECTVDQEITAGDHLIVTLLIDAVAEAEGQLDPLVFHRSRFVTTGPLAEPHPLRV